MVEIGTPCPLAVRAAVYAPPGLSGFDGTVSLPSENNTIRAGGGPLPPPITAPMVAIDCRAVRIACPVAVRSANCSLSIACFIADRTSAPPGEAVTLFVSTTAESFTATAYRIGNYAGSEALQIWKSDSRPDIKQAVSTSGVLGPLAL